MKRLKIIIPIIIFIIILVIGIVYLKYKIEDSKLRANIKEYEVEVYSNKYVSDLVKKYHIINNKKINTNKLGKKTFKIFYRNKKNKKKKLYISVNVVDKSPPLVWLSDSYNVVIGTDDNLLDTILCGDNYDKRPDCKIVGTYDLNTLGSYKLKFIAEDSSSNKTEKDFVLNVKEKEKYKSSETMFNDIYDAYKTENNMVGIDISSWQKNVDFKKIKDSGVSFVMIRVGYQEDINGKLILDSYFEKNIEGALKNNLDVGVYFYSKASTVKEAIEQANFVYKHIKDYNIKLPVVFDWEIFNSFNSLNISLTDLNTVANMFMRKIHSYGYKPALYGSKNYLENIWDMQKYPVWLAHYTEKTNYTNKYFMWQLCNDGIVDGIDGYVDIDILYKNEL